MRNIIAVIISLVVGLIGGYLLRKPKTNTVTEVVTKYYPQKEIQTVVLNKLVPQYFFVPSDSVKVVYKESEVQYMLPKHNYKSSVEGIDIYHSGVFSSIDSLRVSYKKEIKSPHTLELSLGLSYCQELSMPLSLEYSYKMNERFVIGGGVGYDIITKNLFIGAKFGLEISL